MNGTRASHTLAIDLIPPRMTTPTSTVMTSPVSQAGSPTTSLANAATEFDCTMLPMPKAAMAVNAANSMPAHFIPSPRSSTYMGPPAIAPPLVRMRYFTESRASEYLVATPKTPVIQHQNTAPGPPIATAVATPTMLPVPMVAASAVASAPNWLTSPSPSRFLRRDIRTASGMNRCIPRSRNVRKMWVPNSKTSIGGPQR